ncbi:DNA recombination protein RmuC [Roseateles puraquae]|uniref:DNA recombination protein RmuC n=1 Tax=Roseateles puraquae TaxID=431059 RepID=A0A254NC59_9BURK|nr:DNA recombination protein RmuC [Roseateles puraquae]MDG0856567.1 DNA recombination protein RmuC [Roseateles puraquae]OWR03957.1 DNA recombination protein RmuC [Roseateles puraquae]
MTGFELVVLGLLALIFLLLVLIWVRHKPVAGVPPELLQSNERLERELRDELGRSASGTRQELMQGLAQFQQVLTQGLQGSNQSLAAQALAAREAQDAAALRSVQAQAESMQRLNDAMREQLQGLSKRNDERLAELRLTVEQRLTAIQQDNEKKLEQMRATVDEKLHATLEQRLGESFKQVAERLEQVHKGLGEMQNLARDVGSLNRVLTNVKTRGVFGEVQLAGLLEQVFTPEQYAANVATLPGSAERVEFAIKLPGQRDDGQPLWLPIDAKFPREDYERLLDAQERGDVAAADVAGKAIEARLRLEARTIREKYIGPPHTTDFGILFVPTEGLYAEALRRPGLVEGLQREFKVMLCGPTTLLATLTSLQMGFRTLALEKRSAEVWEVLGAVKTEFGKFGDVLAKAKKKLEEAGNTLDAAEVRTRAMTRKLKGVEALPDDASQQLLQLGLGEDAE